MKNRWIRQFTIGLSLVSFFSCSFIGIQASETPAPESTYAPEEWPEVVSDYVYCIDYETGQVLMDKDASAQIYPASMTKMMTSIVAIEHIQDFNETVTITEEMLEGLDEAFASQAGFKEGDMPTYMDLLYGDMLPSGADCSRALAYTLAGSEEAFVGWMNDKAAELGMTGTHFVNTSGLHDDNHYSTCIDMATLLRYAMQNELFAQIIETDHHVSVPVEHFPEGLGMDSSVWCYINYRFPDVKYQWEIPGFLGGKSGWTLEGLHCLASVAEIQGMPVILVTAHAYKGSYYPIQVEDAAAIYGELEDHYARQTFFQQGETIYTLPIKGTFQHDTYSLVVPETITFDAARDENLHIEYNIPEEVDSPVEEGTMLGSVDIYSYDTLMESIPFVADRTVKGSFFGRARDLVEAYPLAVVSILGILLIVLLLLHYRNQKWKKKRKRKRSH